MAKIYKCMLCSKNLDYCHAKNCWRYECECDTNHVQVTSDADIRLCVAVMSRLQKSEYYSNENVTWWED